ncbi:MAG: hypothetical protein R3F11_10550 [Verrucomicrobiales bacterium]
MAAFFKADGSAYRVGETLRQPDLAKQRGSTSPGESPSRLQRSYCQALKRRHGGHGRFQSRAETCADLRQSGASRSATYRGCLRSCDRRPAPAASTSSDAQRARTSRSTTTAPAPPKAIPMVETMKLFFAREPLGAPRHVTANLYRVPQAWPASKEYAADLAKRIDGRATPSAEIKPGAPPAPEGPETTRSTRQPANVRPDLRI